MDLMLIMRIGTMVPHAVVLHEKHQRRQEGAERLKPLQALSSAWPQGTAALRASCNAVDSPWVGLGGYPAADGDNIIQAGADEWGDGTFEMWIQNYEASQPFALYAFAA